MKFESVIKTLKTSDLYQHILAFVGSSNKHKNVQKERN